MTGGAPVPARITLALDAGGHYGPEVDTAVGTFEGNPDGDVDAWEDTEDPRLPNAEQVKKLAELTGYPVSWFYEPHTPRPTTGTICWSDKRGCELVEDDGVPVPPGREAGQHTLPMMPAPPPAPAGRPAAANGPARRRAPAPGQLTLPAGRLDDGERAKLMARLEEARRRRR